MKDPQTLKTPRCFTLKAHSTWSMFVFVMHVIYNPSATSPSFMVSCDAASSHSNGCSPHFSTPFLITHPHTHKIPPAPEPPSANLSPSTACANSAVGRRGRTFHRLHGNCGNRTRHLCSTETKNRGVRKSRLVRVRLACDYCTKERLTSQMQVLKQQTTLNTTITSSIIAV